MGLRLCEVLELWSPVLLVSQPVLHNHLLARKLTIIYLNMSLTRSSKVGVRIRGWGLRGSLVSGL